MEGVRSKNVHQQTTISRSLLQLDGAARCSTALLAVIIVVEKELRF